MVRLMTGLRKIIIHFCIGLDITTNVAAIMKFTPKLVSMVFLAMTYNFVTSELDLSQQSHRLGITYLKYKIEKLKDSQE